MPTADAGDASHDGEVGRMLFWTLLGARTGPARREGPPRRHPVRPAVEGLEDRYVLSAAANPAVVAAPSQDSQWLAGAAALARHHRGRPNVIFLGDSILEFYADGNGREVWRAEIERLRADDLAIRSSTTATVLWQIGHDQLRGLSPRVVVLMIGLNNLRAGETPEQTAAGVAACVTAIRSALPRSRVLLLGLLPAGASPSNPLRDEVIRTNTLLVPLADDRTVFYLDVGARLLQSDGSISPAVLYDGIHPTAAGYETLTQSLRPVLVQLLGMPRLPRPPSPSSGPASGTDTGQLSHPLFLPPAHH